MSVLGWPLAVLKFSKVKMLHLPTPDPVPTNQIRNCAKFQLNRTTARRPSNAFKLEHNMHND